MSGADPNQKPYADLDPESFRGRGYAVIRQVLDAEEVEQLRTRIEEAISQGEREGRAVPSTGQEGTIRHGPGDVLSNPPVRYVLLDPRVLGIVQELLGGELVYWGDSAMRIGKNGERGWHRDNVDRRRLWHRDQADRRHWRQGPDWRSEDYPLLRCAFYLQDQSRHSGGLALRPCSHRPGLVRPTRPLLVDARAGDLVVWSLRTVHSAEVARLRWLPGFPLNPRVQTWLSQSLRLPEETERVAVFMTFGRAGADLDRYIEYLKSRDYMQTTWASSHFGPEVWEEAAGAGLRVMQPVPAYGTPPPTARASLQL